MAESSVMVPLARIPTDEAAQMRARVRGGVVRIYAAAMKEQHAQGGLRFPPRRCLVDHKVVSRMRRGASGSRVFEAAAASPSFSITSFGCFDLTT